MRIALRMTATITVPVAVETATNTTELGRCTWGAATADSPLGSTAMGRSIIMPKIVPTTVGSAKVCSPKHPGNWTTAYDTPL
jgi:hypothetical protein